MREHESYDPMTPKEAAALAEPDHKETRPYRVVPAPGRIAVEVEDAERMVSGLYLVTLGPDKPTSGRVIAICPDYEEDGEPAPPPMFQIGDKVVFGKFSGAELQIDRRKIIVLRESEILCKLVQDADST